MGVFGINEILTVLYEIWPHILGVGLLILMYVLGVFNARENDKHIRCDSPGCMRCRAYTSRSMVLLQQDWINYRSNLPKQDLYKVNRITQTIMRQRIASQQGFQKQTIFQLANLSTNPRYETEIFKSDVELLETNYEKIGKEFFNVNSLYKFSNSWKVNSTPSGEWRAFYLVNQGQEIKDNIQQCPGTYTILKQLGNVMTNCIFGNVCFSVVEPGTHISEHHGPCNIRVRCHLGIDVSSNCELFVNDQRLQWERGKCILFDDSYLHSVMYRKSGDTDRHRVVLLVDFWNPELSFDEVKGLQFLFDPDKFQI